MLNPGTKVGHYSIVGHIGAGGMGEVYRATDTKLRRDVALKVLPEVFAKDAERMARFSREAVVLASLNHPNIAAIYGLEEQDGIRALVLELVEGPTLADRIKDGPLPPDEALGIAKQIAEALEAAHEQGIIHRDLKPANVKVREDGQVKVLDFGLAKALEDPNPEEDPGNSPTLSIAATRAGVILGTAAYMSPEQAKGKKADRRADIWAFGIVLYEMLSGKRAYTGDSISEVLAAVLMKEPDYDALPETVSAPLRKLLRRCLTKDRTQRLQAIGEARIAITEFVADSAASSVMISPPMAEPQPTWLRWTPWAAGALALVSIVSVAGWWQATRPVEQSPMRLHVEVAPDNPLFTSIGAAAVLSPDGKLLAYVATEGGTQKLYVRPLDQMEATALSGTEGARNPFFSPDGQWIGFFTGSALKKVSVSGGAPLTLTSAGDGRGGTWSEDDTIVLASNTTTGLSRVSAAGGEPEEVTTPGEGERSHRWPWFLPGGKAALFMTQDDGQAYDDSDIEAVNLATGERTVVHRGGTYPRYLPSGHLIYVRDGTLFAVPFDPDRLETTGQPAPILEGVLFSGNTSAGNGGAQYAFSQNGTLAYLAGTVADQSFPVVWADRKGATTALLDEARAYSSPRLSPDGKRVAFHIDTGDSRDIWLYEIARGAMTRLTFVGDSNIVPIWTPDGSRVAFASTRTGSGQPIFWKRADGAGEAEQLTSGATTQGPGSFSPDGRFLAYFADSPETGFDLWVVPLEGDRKPETFLASPATEVFPEFSPDGRWIGYMSNESGRMEIYVRPFPGPGGKWQVSTEGGAFQRWTRNGGELIYRQGSKWMAVEISAEGDSLRAGKPQEIFEGAFLNLARFPAYDVSRDGNRFVLFPAAEDTGVVSRTHLNFIFNWFDTLP